ncbi:MAG: YceI family protein [Gemmatimonadales bacterium]|nr:YceI family protein [Gemmatimonadales bacterium]
MTPLFLAVSMLAAAQAAEPVTLSLAPSGNEVRFVVREQLVGVELPNDAIGATSTITGGLVIDAKGMVDRARSIFTVDLTTLKSDRDRRDNFIKRRTIVTDSFPNAVLAVTEVKGLPAKLPVSGNFTFTLIGDFTIRGVTKPTTWEVAATAAGGAFTGKATTHITFGDFNMTRPRVPVVLSVVDDIKLEYDFHFIRAAAKP